MLKKEQAYRELRRKILQGKFVRGQRLPGEISLSEELGVSRITLRSAMQELANDGLITLSGHAGNYVSSQIGGRRYLFIIPSPDVNALNISDIYLTDALRQQLANAGDRLELLSCFQLAEFAESQWNQLLSLSPPDGIILHGGEFTGCRKILDAFARLPKDTVIIGSVKEGERSLFEDYPSVRLQSTGCLKDGIRYLKKLGHERIATVFPEDSDFRGFTLPLYQEFLECCGLADCRELVTVCSIEQIGNRVRRLLFGENPPTAFMCYCDATAQQVCDELHRLDIAIPQQVSVLGICGYSKRLYMIPELSVVNFHYDRMAGKALELLYQLKVGTLSAGGRHVISGYDIEEQESTAAPPEKIKVRHGCPIGFPCVCS